MKENGRALPAILSLLATVPDEYKKTGLESE